jgi:regulator of sirC expression with transglutaminase-like and TPR domain
VVESHRVIEGEGPQELNYKSSDRVRAGFLLRRRAFIATGLASIVAPPFSASAKSLSPAETVRSILTVPDDELDYGQAAVRIDSLLDPKSDPAITRAMIARLVDAARQMAGPNPTDVYKLAAIRKAIYVSGPWNYGRAFAYDQTDPLGKDTHNKLLSAYIRKRLGNCVSMPILFLIVADRMGLNVRLATAPLHVFVRYISSNGDETNLEATSGGHVTRTEWYRQNLPMTDEAIAKGAYMRTFSRRESVAEMANTVVDMMMDQQRWRDAIEVADAILSVNPRETYTLVKRGSAYGQLLQAEFIDHYPTPVAIPAPLRARYQMLGSENEKSFRDAEALGWKAD